MWQMSADSISYCAGPGRPWLRRQVLAHTDFNCFLLGLPQLQDFCDKDNINGLFGIGIKKLRTLPGLALHSSWHLQRISEFSSFSYLGLLREGFGIVLKIQVFVGLSSAH